MADLHLLGAAVRGFRERTAPADVGVRDLGGRRRARGLRREELAGLAGVSEDYLRRVEQGRRHPSADVVNALARALRLPQPDYERLCALAGFAPTAGTVPREAGPAAERFLRRMAGTAVCVVDATWTVVAWTPAWRAMCSTASDSDPAGRNVARQIFTGERSSIRRTAEEETEFRRLLVDDLRRASLRYPRDDALAGLVAALREASEAFDALWTSPAAPGPVSGRVLLDDPEFGSIAIDSDIVGLRDDDLRAVVFTAAAGSADADRLAALLDPRVETDLHPFYGAGSTR
ncbi:helix-turn-helix domain-containing protein [Lentzea sp. NPDC059081]|uniref:MmyB family transcriptional regulator n=1 Tax=Lentzea sp. NPDC059081 TaxID=3346719 RepID=UPI0036C981D8